MKNQNDVHAGCRGMSSETLAKLGQENFSFGKANGNGLGISHAKKFIESAGGKLSFLSQIEPKNETGTIVKIALPRAF